ncbi:tripartite tricarboxylate transporter substrate binding protein [Ramlibacter sp. G-1-2-2]|uniref:Tripartite tricarboxylate transporter substrate binding protein n=1 Tax=Ramlibacter agri TaxID=2728837 RepID=A0A848H4V2_9BURK|nr:tripartite tricarboxylate transporter substrate binding protein [Ramlibacter agri]NML44822.1 tripartite tricarboxylate transporter substrate binding protein [Ramlibacter agri]
MSFHDSLLSRRTVLQALTASAFAPQAFAQAGFPARTVELIVPYPPGGSTDVVARMLAAKMPALLGQTMIVDNRAGGNGNIGTAFVARSPADGHRLLMATSALVTINPHIHKNPGFEPFKDFAPVSLICNGALVVAVGAQSPVKSLRDLIALAKKEPKGVFYATPSSGTPQHLMGELLNQAAGISMTPVHYKGVAPAITDLIGGQVQVLFSTYAAIKPQVDSGKMRVIAVAEARRLPEAPQVPTIAETFPGFEMTTWFGIFAPAGTPAPVIAKLEKSFAAAVATKEAQDLLQSLALPPVGGSAAQLAQVLRRDYDKLGKVIREKNITAD